jgi:1,3-beta-glucan synthase
VYVTDGHTVVFLGTMLAELPICRYANGILLGPQGCYNLQPVHDWINRCIVSIFLVFIIAFLPLFLQGMIYVLDYYCGTAD